MSAGVAFVLDFSDDLVTVLGTPAPEGISLVGKGVALLLLFLARDATIKNRSLRVVPVGAAP